MKRLQIGSLFFIICFVVCMVGPANVQASTYKKEDFVVEAHDLKRPTVLNKGQKFSISGTIEANKEISKIGIYVEDLDLFKKEIKLEKEVGSYSVNLSDYNSYISLSKLSSGVKELKIKLYDNDGNNVKLTRTFTVLGKAKEPIHITGKCKIKASTGNVSNVTDSTVNTYWNGGTMTINLPDDRIADGILIKWHVTTNEYTFKSYNADGEILDEYDGNGYRMIHKYYTLDENSKKVVIKLKKSKCNNGICTLRVYEKDKVGASVERWKSPSVGDCDLMVFSAHRDDELLFFGGTIPYYQSVRQKNVITVYMSGRDRLRVREALAGQWSMGNSTYPLFLNFPGGYHDGIKGTLSSWGGEDHVLKVLVEKIRKYKPKVVVTHDENGEYGHPTHKTTAYLIKKAIKLAADETKFSDSLDKYGAWQVKKLYLHNYSKNKVKMNWNRKSTDLDGKTPYQAAVVAYDKHVSQHGSWSMNCSTVKKYPNNEFGLVFSKVGPDKSKNDFFENIDE